MTVEHCPACGETRLRCYPTTADGRRVFTCPSCGMAGWRDRDSLSLPAVVDLDRISLAEHRRWHEGLREVSDATWDEALDAIEAELGDPTGRRLYDVGSGDGGFSALARARGFTAGGNDLLEAAVLLAEESHGIRLDLGGLAGLDIEPQDVFTLWCVIAHDAEPRALLQACFERLKPGGLLVLQTPHRTVVDLLAIAALRLTRGRASKLVDRRIAGHHWFLSTRRSMTAMLESIGFVDVVVQPRARYSLQTSAYVGWLGFRGRPQRVLTRIADGMLRRNLAPRIVLDVTARRPH